MPNDTGSNGYKFEVYKNRKDQWYWHFKAPNGQLMQQSEGYTRKANALKAIKSIQRNAADAESVELK